MLCASAFALALAAALAGTVSWGLPAFGQNSNKTGDIEHDLSMWTPIYLTAPLYKRRLGGYLEVQPRLSNDVTRMNQMLIRPALSLRLTRRLSSMAGYAFIQTYQPSSFYENRIWQQLNLSTPIKKLEMYNRSRFEQRLIQDVGGVALRWRQLLGFRYPHKSRGWYLNVYDELFVNFNSPTDGPQAGIDQNRIFVGVGRHLNRRVRAEIGYINQYINRTEVDDLGNHVVVLGLYSDL